MVSVAATVAFIIVIIATLSEASPVAKHKNAHCAQKSSPPCKQFDCTVRKFALEFARNKLDWSSSSDASRHVYDALRLNECGGIMENYKDNSVVVDQDKKQWKSIRNRRRNQVSTVEFSDPSNTSQHQQQRKIFVDAVKGHDNADGSMDRPLKTIVAARDLARTMILDTVHQPIIIFLRGGRYFFKETLVLDERDHGITIEAYNNEKVILSGGHELNLMMRPTNADPRIYYCDNRSPTNNGRGSSPTPYYDFTLLFKRASSTDGAADDERLVWAREPNGHPERDQQPDGYATASGRGSAGKWPDLGKDGIHLAVKEPRRNSSVYPFFGEDLDPRGGGNWYHVGGDATRFVDRRGFWNGSVPMGLKYNETTFDASGWTPQGYRGAIAHVFHNALWGNWQFPIRSVDQSNQQIYFHQGGWQEGRGGDINQNPFFVEGVKEALDAPGEWWLDRDDQVLYYYPHPNETGHSDGAPDCEVPMKFVAPHLKRLVAIAGSSETDPAINITLRGLTFAHTANTFLDKYEVPSPGDWSIRRDASLFVENVEGLTVDLCRFVRTGGNAIFLSGHVKSSHLSRNEFAWIGDSAIVSVGRLEMADGFTVNAFPEDIIIRANHFHEIGIHGKQTSALFAALSCRISFLDNVAYNGPRAGVNLNDAFCHGHRINGNLLFNWVRETQDHGPINTWNRAMYVQRDPITNEPTLVPEWARISQNFIMNGPSGNRDLGNLFPAIDNDDGSSHFFISKNFLVYGGAKNYLGQDKVWTENLIAYPGRWSGDPCAQLWAGKKNRFQGNTCILGPDNEPIGLDSTRQGFECVIDWANVSALEFVARSANNTYYLNREMDQWGFYCGNGTSSQHFFTMDEMKSNGWEQNSSIRESKTLSDEAIIRMAKELLQMPL